MVAVIIAAHDEEAVIGRCLDALTSQLRPGDEIVVSANGCRDRTAAIAADRGAIVVDREEPGKAAALNAAEEVATSFPRLYLDADIEMPPGSLGALLDALAVPGVEAVVPGRRIDVRGCPWPVRGYFAVNERLPAFRDGLFGRGAIVVSEAGRARFDDFPTLIADDLFLDSLFPSDAKREVGAATVRVAAPRRTRDLLSRLIRVRRGNAQLRAAAAAGDLTAAVRPSDRWAWLRDVVVPHPHLALAAVPYVAITVIAGLRSRRAGTGWGRDESTRAAPSERASA